MRIAVAALAAFSQRPGWHTPPASRARSRQIDGEAMTITLDNGDHLSAPGEFNMQAIDVGTEVLIAFDQIEGQRQITDMDIME